MKQAFKTTYELEKGDIFTPKFAKVRRQERIKKANGKPFISYSIGIDGGKYLNLTKTQAEFIDANGMVEYIAHEYMNKMGKVCIGLRVHDKNALVTAPEPKIAFKKEPTYPFLEEVMGWYRDGAEEKRIKATLIQLGRLSEEEAERVMAHAKTKV
jgi:hypothetical protein